MAGKNRTFGFKVTLVGGPSGEKGWKKGQSREVALSGTESLAALHAAILKAFGRKDGEPLYLFSFGEEVGDFKGDCYSEVENHRKPFPNEGPGWIRDARNAPIAGLSLAKGSRFTYWFDFGADWVHRVDVARVP